MDFPAERLEYTLLNPSERAAAGDVSGQGMVSAQLSGSLGRRPISSESPISVNHCVPSLSSLNYFIDCRRVRVDGEGAFW